MGIVAMIRSWLATDRTGPTHAAALHVSAERTPPPPPAPTEADLVQAAAERHHEEFEALQVRHEESVARLNRRTADALRPPRQPPSDWDYRRTFPRSVDEMAKDADLRVKWAETMAAIRPKKDTD